MRKESDIFEFQWHSLLVFHSHVSWWSFTGICITAYLLWFLGLFWVFQLILTMLWLVLLLPLISNSSNLFSKLLETFLLFQLQLVSLSNLCSTAFSVLWQDLRSCLSFCFLSFLPYDPWELQNLTDDNFFFLLINSWSCLVEIWWSAWTSKF